jgi:hypothetical protein
MKSSQDNIDIYELTHVRSVNYTFNNWIVNCDKDLNESNESVSPISYIFVIDTLYHDAFSHWVFESAIYLPLFILLKTKYPTLKLYLKEYKNYKKIFCEYFKINENDIIYEITYPNTCLFPNPISSLNINSITEKYIYQIDNFLNLKSNKKTIQTLFLPRQTKENYNNNNRYYDVSNFLQNIDTSHNFILHTDNVTDLNYQIDIVNSSKNVILMGGSSYFVNGLFCQNSNIIVLDGCMNQINSFIKLKYIHDKICKNNNVTFCKFTNYNDIAHLINDSL